MSGLEKELLEAVGIVEMVVVVVVLMWGMRVHATVNLSTHHVGSGMELRFYAQLQAPFSSK